MGFLSSGVLDAETFHTAANTYLYTPYLQDAMLRQLTGRGFEGDPDPAERESQLRRTMSGKDILLVCRGTWARVTIDRFRCVALHIF